MSHVHTKLKIRSKLSYIDLWFYVKLKRWKAHINTNAVFSFVEKFEFEKVYARGI